MPGSDGREMSAALRILLRLRPRSHIHVLPFAACGEPLLFASPEAKIPRFS
jgi:hypothetical protein